MSNGEHNNVCINACACMHHLTTIKQYRDRSEIVHIFLKFRTVKNLTGDFTQKPHQYSCYDSAPQ